MLHLPWTGRIGRVISSPERKARQTAALLARHRSVEVEVRADTYEMDRSSTGFVEPETFDNLVERFFAHPAHSIEGWETANRPRNASPERWPTYWPATATTAGIAAAGTATVSRSSATAASEPSGTATWPTFPSPGNMTSRSRATTSPSMTTDARFMRGSR
jgi:hypothetical protein